MRLQLPMPIDVNCSINTSVFLSGCGRTKKQSHLLDDDTSETVPNEDNGTGFLLENTEVSSLPQKSKYFLSSRHSLPPPSGVCHPMQVSNVVHSPSVSH